MPVRADIIEIATGMQLVRACLPTDTRFQSQFLVQVAQVLLEGRIPDTQSVVRHNNTVSIDIELERSSYHHAPY